MRAKKPEKQKNLIMCPECGGIDIAIYEHLELLRGWFQDEDGIGEDRFDRRRVEQVFAWYGPPQDANPQPYP